MGADFPMIPSESTVFSRACKPISLWAVPCQITAKASAPQVPWCVLCWWLQHGVQEAMGWCQPIDSYTFSCGSFRETAGNLVETAHRKSQDVS
jgi:hypothetical protein